MSSVQSILPRFGGCACNDEAAGERVACAGGVNRSLQRDGSDRCEDLSVVCAHLSDPGASFDDEGYVDDRALNEIKVLGLFFVCEEMRCATRSESGSTLLWAPLGECADR
jgi:hypothetical protein